MSASPIGKKYIASIRTENLQDYLNWIVYKSTINSKNIEEKIEKLVDNCFQSKVIYRKKTDIKSLLQQPFYKHY